MSILRGVGIIFGPALFPLDMAVGGSTAEGRSGPEGEMVLDLGLDLASQVGSSPEGDGGGAEDELAAAETGSDEGDGKGGGRSHLARTWLAGLLRQRSPRVARHLEHPMSCSWLGAGERGVSEHLVFFGGGCWAPFGFEGYHDPGGRKEASILPSSNQGSDIAEAGRADGGDAQGIVVEGAGGRGEIPLPDLEPEIGDGAEDGIALMAFARDEVHLPCGARGSERRARRWPWRCVRIVLPDRRAEGRGGTRVEDEGRGRGSEAAAWPITSLAAGAATLGSGA